MTDDFYRAFEEKYRGSRELIKKRLTAYRPFLDQLLTVYPEGHAVDLGCGRGEWLEYVSQLGFSAKGVDLDEGMLAACVDLGLSAEKEDLLSFLRRVDDGSLALVSAFHVVEHISFDDLRTLAAEVMRVLKPGGLFIMETPNPENIVVSTCNFYFDPTHEKPIPAQLLSFVAEFAGFKRTKIMRLQEAAELISKADISMTELLTGVSPDYAIVAQKDAEPETMAVFGEVFERTYGLGLDELSVRFDKRLTDIEASSREAEHKAQEMEANLTALLNSRSWRITAPMRTAGHIISKVRQADIRSQLRMLPHHARLFLNQRPRAKRLILRVIDCFPGARNQLHRLSRPKTLFSKGDYIYQATELRELGPHARRIYRELNVMIEGQREK